MPLHLYLLCMCATFISFLAFHLCRCTFVSPSICSWHVSPVHLSRCCMHLSRCCMHLSHQWNHKIFDLSHLCICLIVASWTDGSVKSLFMTNICPFSYLLYFLYYRLIRTELRCRRTQPPVVKPKAVTAPLALRPAADSAVRRRWPYKGQNRGGRGWKRRPQGGACSGHWGRW